MGKKDRINEPHIKTTLFSVLILDSFCAFGQTPGRLSTGNVRGMKRIRESLEGADYLSDHGLARLETKNLSALNGCR